MKCRSPIMCLFALPLIAAHLFACSDVESSTDGSTFGKTSAYFAPDLDNPERSLLPLPNILALNRDTSPPTLNLKSSQCFESGSLTETTLDGLEQLNGFGTYSAGNIMTFFGDELDEQSLTDKVLLVDLGTFGADQEDADLEQPLSVSLQLAGAPKYLNGCEAEPVMVPAMTIMPLDETDDLPVVLKSNHQYAVALLDGILDAEGREVLPFYIWALIRSEEEQSDLSLKELQYIHEPVLQAFEAMGHTRDEIILAWTFNTQFTDSAMVDIAGRLGILGEEHDSTTVTIPATTLQVPPMPPQDFLGAIGLSCDAIGAGPDCPGIGTLLSGQFTSPRFQQAAHITPPYQAIEGGASWVPGTFTSNTHPEVQGIEGSTVSFLASSPAGVSESYPVVIFQHPLTPTDPEAATSANKMAMLSLANTLGAGGMGVVAIDGVLAGDRAVLVHDTVDDATELYPVLNSNAFVTRDNIRQTAVDLLQLVRVLKACTPATCGGLKIDTQRIYFLGTSLGSTSGSLLVALSDDIKRAVFNAPGAGLADILATSPVLSMQLSPALCSGGIISALCCDDSPPSCTPDDLASDPGFAQFKLSAQWILDPGDPVNYASRIAIGIARGYKRVLVQQAIGDKVFANTATSLFAELLGLDATDSKSYDPGACGSVPGGAHGMLLRNCGTGTADMQTDILTFFMSP